MCESKPGRVQRLPVKLQFLQYAGMRLSSTTIDRITNQGMTGRGHVNPDLVGPSRFEPALHERRISQNIQPSPVRHGPFSASSLNDRDLLAIGRRARERGIDASRARLWNAVDDREVNPIDRMRRELFCKTLV